MKHAHISHTYSKNGWFRITGMEGIERGRRSWEFRAKNGVRLKSIFLPGIHKYEKESPDLCLWGEDKSKDNTAIKMSKADYALIKEAIDEFNDKFSQKETK